MKEIIIYILSDSIGETAEQTVRASIAQFENLKYEIKKFSHIRSVTVLDNILNEIDDMDNTLMFYSLVDDTLLTMIKKFCDINNIVNVDILTPSIVAIERLSDLNPSTKPGALRKLDENYFKRVEAIEFAVRYDDGKDPRGLLIADLAIIGISRTSKTPLSMYLANKNYRVANIPLVPETLPPDELFQIPTKKIVGLTNSPENLNKIRKERLKSLGLPLGSSYSDLERILQEIEYAHEIMKKIGCPIIDVSNKAIEETADIILNYLRKANNSII
ncbi:MAG: pyruvate, water dikinase regulatory protein [Tissierellia bacterium]|nr:pyruvate, water dikinase regulatory protein [Tissierellia bacterium]